MKPSIPLIFANDWPALACLIGVPVLWLIHFFTPLIAPSADPFDPARLAFAAVITFVLIVVAAWRVDRVMGLFRSGASAEGCILRCTIVRDRGRVEFVFSVDGAVVDSWMPVHRTRRVLALQMGQPVTVLYDPARPRRAILRDLFV